jgi:hypothetical protein
LWQRSIAPAYDPTTLKEISMPTALEPLFDQLVTKEVPLEALFLDPNNPRFVDLQSAFVPDERITDVAMQENALAILEKRFGLDRLRMSIGVNG